MKHPAPKGIAISHCGTCARVSFARQVNQLDRVPRRYCRFCGTPVDVVHYTRDAEQPLVEYVDEDLTAGGNPIRSSP
ncbi:MAG TPA: hypothetical protein VE987_13015 [Polyangiaceae bacterium]|nr:hypothetical protein [Polyangiaceae bacterium]